MQAHGQQVEQQSSTTNQYTTSSLPEPTVQEHSLAYDNARWADQVDNFYYLGSPVSLSTTSQLEYTSPTDQDMVDFLTQALPDIWMPEAIPEFDSLANAMITGDGSQNTFQVPDISGNTGTNEYENEQEADSITVAHPETHQSGETDFRHESPALDVPRAVIDNL